MLVLSADGKGIVMRPDSLRPATAKAAAKASSKLATRLSKGEKRNRKRLAEVGAVYDLAPVPRQATDVLAGKRGEHPPPAAPKAKNKWLNASVVDDAAPVVAASSTKPNDATPTIGAAGSRWSTATTTRSSASRPKRAPRGIVVTIVIDLIHVLEYLSAPRGALLYPRLSREELGGSSLGLMAYLDPKGDRGQEHARKPAAVPRCQGRCAGGPA